MTANGLRNAPGGIRTPDRRIRNPLLYPTELRALKAVFTSIYTRLATHPEKQRLQSLLQPRYVVIANARQRVFYDKTTMAGLAPQDHAREFPSTLPPTGQYGKKIRGTLYYFDTDSKLAVERYLPQASYLHDGRARSPFLTMFRFRAIGRRSSAYYLRGLSAAPRRTSAALGGTLIRSVCK